jgi:hypothetical protein
MPRMCNDFEFDPMDERLLRSTRRTEVPTHDYIHIAGDRYPCESDLAPLLNPATEGNATILPFASVIARTPQGDERRVIYNCTIVLPDRVRNSHVCVWGMTGAGKTTKVMQNLIASDVADLQRTVIVGDLKCEQYPFLKALCDKYGRNLTVVNLADPTRSSAFNPLQDADERQAHSVISAFAELTTNPRSHDSEFWKHMKVSFSFAAWQAGLRSFPAFADLYQSPREEIVQFLKERAHLGSCRSMAAFIGGNSQNSDTALAELCGALNVFYSPNVRAVMSSNELDMGSLFDEASVVLIECPEPELPTLRPAYNILISCLLDAAVAYADRHAAQQPGRPIAFHLDDLPSFGRLSNLADRLNTLRSRRISINAGIQSRAALQSAYGPDADLVLAGFMNKIVLPGLDQTDAEFFSRSTGECQVALSAPSRESHVTTRRVLSSSDINRPAWQHYLYGRPATFLLQDVACQVYLLPAYLRTDLQDVVKRAGRIERSGSLRTNALRAAPTLVKTTQPTLSDTRGWSEERIRQQLDETMQEIGWAETTDSAARWWTEFLKENGQRLSLCLRLAEELKNRAATITEFFLAYVYSNTDNIQANLHYLDYVRLKRQEEQRKRKPDEERQRDSPA